MAVDSQYNKIPDLEPLLDLNSFGQTRMESGLRAIAKRINNLLFMEKGTCIDCFNMGVGIKLYLFDRMQDDSIKSLAGEIKSQLTKYLPDIDINSVEVQNDEEKLAANTSRGALNIFIILAKPIEGKNYLVLKAEGKKNKTVDISSFIA